MFVHAHPAPIHLHCTHHVPSGPCPTCGVCPTCGSRPWVAPLRPVQPIWAQPVIPFRVHHHNVISQAINRLGGAA